MLKNWFGKFWFSFAFGNIKCLYISQGSGTIAQDRQGEVVSVSNSQLEALTPCLLPEIMIVAENGP